MRSLTRLLALLFFAFSFGAVQAQDIPVKSFPAYGMGFGSRMSPDGRLLATYENGVIQNNEVIADLLPIRVYDVMTGQPVGLLSGEPDYAVDVAFSPDNNQLAALYPTGWVHIWTIADGERVERLPVAPNAIRIAWMPDGETLVIAAGQLPQIQLWDVNSGAMTTLLTDRYRTIAEQQEVLRSGPLDGVAAFIASPNGQQFVMATAYGRIQYWTPDGEFALLYDPELDNPVFPVRALALTSDSLRLFTLDSTDDVVRVFSAPNGELLDEIPAPDANPTTLAVSADGTRAAWLARPTDETTVLVIVNLATGETQTLPLPSDVPQEWRGPIIGFYFSADGRQIILTGHFEAGADPNDNQVYLLTLPE